MCGKNGWKPSEIPLAVRTRVRIVDEVKNRYFEWTGPARRDGWTGRVSELCGRPLEDYVRVDFDLRPRQRRQRLAELVAIRDLIVIPDDPTCEPDAVGRAPASVKVCDPVART